jgi:transposase
MRVGYLRHCFETKIARLPGRSPSTEAIRYALNHWHGLERFLHRWTHRTRHQLRQAEHASYALSRENPMFAGSDEAAETWAALASLDRNL